MPVASGPSTATSASSVSDTHSTPMIGACIATSVSSVSSTPMILRQQAGMLDLLNEKVASLEETIQSLENESKEETLLQEAEYQCPLCLDLAWYPYITACGHCFCSRCLSRYKAKHDRKCLEDPSSTDVIIRCPACRSPIYRKPLRSLVIQQGIEHVAVDLQVEAPVPHLLEWHYQH
ncbi:hypothetical protein EV368DRAFT_68543 [Lentinula lateritia]|nr:hypothetical protein EV368DRAFT_68543 [Lentinula lateritia]